MVPAPRPVLNAYSNSSRFLYSLLSLATQQAPKIFRRNTSGSCQAPFSSKCIAFAVLIPVLVLLSGVFAGLTLGYMSLDETQLNVLSISGTPYAYPFSILLTPHI